MKIVYTEGCTCFSLTIDKKDVQDLSEVEIKNTLLKVIEHLNKDDVIQILQDVAQRVGEYKYVDHCDECNDDICEYSIKIK